MMTGAVIMLMRVPHDYIHYQLLVQQSLNVVQLFLVGGNDHEY